MWNQIQQTLNQSATSVMAGIVQLIPGTIALLVSIGLAAVVGGLLRVVLRRALGGIDFDNRVASWGWSSVAGRTGAMSPTLLVTRIVWWAVVFLGVMVGLAAFDPTLTSQLALGLFGSAMNLVMAAVILLVGTLLARFLSRSVLISLVNMNVQQARLLSLGIKWLVLIMAAAMALDHLKVGGRIVELAFGILFGGIVFALALAFGLRSRDFEKWSMAQQAKEDPAKGGPPVDHL